MNKKDKKAMRLEKELDNIEKMEEEKSRSS
jgi:hypothetical protein